MLKVHGLLLLNYNFCVAPIIFYGYKNMTDTTVSCKHHKSTTAHHYNSIQPPNNDWKLDAINDAWGTGFKAVQDTQPKQTHKC